MPVAAGWPSFCDGIDRQFAKSSPSRDDGFADYDFGNDSIVAGCHVRFVGGFYYGWVAVRHVDNVAFYPDFVCIILSYKKDRQMKKEILVAISVAGVLFGLSVSLAAQEKLSLAQCREMVPRHEPSRHYPRSAYKHQFLFHAASQPPDENSP